MKALKLIPFLAITLLFMACSNDDDTPVQEEETTNLRPSRIDISNNQDDPVVFIIDYNSINKISEIKKLRGSLTETAAFSYNNEKKLTKIVNNNGATQEIFLVTYDTAGKLAKIISGSDIITFTPTTLGYKVNHPLLGEFEIRFNSNGQLVFIGEDIRIAINENIKGPFYNVEMDTALIYRYLFDFFYFGINAITSFSNFLIYDQTTVSNTTNEAGYIISSLIKFDEGNPSMRTEEVNYTYQEI